MMYLIGFGVLLFILFLFGGSSGSKSNYRKNGLNTARRDNNGNVQDAYTGRYHKAKNMDADHIYPKSRGGSNSDYNIAMTHKSVNRSKGNKIQPIRMTKAYVKNENVRKSAKAATAGASILAAVSSMVE